MLIGGLQRLSLIDYPEMICATVFTQGCNFRCGYCHNAELADPERFAALISEDFFFTFLEKRKGQLDAVTISGGEPTIQPDLASVLKSIKSLGFRTKLDTNGSRPAVLEALMKDSLVDYFAMDIKAPFEKYESIVRRRVDVADIKESIRLIMYSGIPYEFRTTAVKALLQPSDIIEISRLIENAQQYYIQRFRYTSVMDESCLSQDNYSEEELMAVKNFLEGNIQRVSIR